MGEHFAKGEVYLEKGLKKMNGWSFFGNKYEDAADWLDKAANSFKLAKSWDKAGDTYVKLAECHLQLNSLHEAANAYVDAGHCFKKIDVNSKSQGALDSLKQAIELYEHERRLPLCAKCCKEMAEIYEKGVNKEDLENAIERYEKAADYFSTSDQQSSADSCIKVAAGLCAQTEEYQKAIEFYEELANHAVNNNLLKYGVRGHLLNAGICKLCQGDIVAIKNALEKYEELDPTFSGTREYKLLADLAESLDEEDVAKFTNAVKEYDSMTQLEPLRTTLLLRVKESIKAKELEEDDLT